MHVLGGRPEDVFIMKLASIFVPVLGALIVGSIFWGINQEYKNILSAINVPDILYQEKMASGAPRGPSFFSTYGWANNCLVVVFLKDRFFIRAPRTVKALVSPIFSGYDQEILYSELRSCTVKKMLFSEYFILKLNRPPEKEYYTLMVRNPSRVLDIFRSKGILID